ncbi:Protein C16B8.2, partial [Aphelenchoides avenae]
MTKSTDIPVSDADKLSNATIFDHKQISINCLHHASINFESLSAAKACHVDSDCDANGQFCELGRCQCAHGFIQDMERSGLCKTDPVFTKAREKALSEADQWRPQPKKVVKPELRKPAQSLPPIPRRPWGRWPVSHVKRHRRAAHLPTKPHREERLQWP